MKRMGGAMNTRFASLALAALLAGPALADNASGPHRVTLVEEPWGTIYYVPGALKDYDYTADTDANVRVMKSAQGTATITGNGLGSYNVTVAKGQEFSVDAGETGQVSVTFGGANYDFKGGPGSFDVTTPKSKTAYRFSDKEDSVTGPRGPMKATRHGGDYHVESSAGVLDYKVTTKGFSVHGVGVTHHPYLERGARFEKNGIGIFIDYKKLAPDSALMHFVEWDKISEFRK